MCGSQLTAYCVQASQRRDTAALACRLLTPKVTALLLEVGCSLLSSPPPSRGPAAWLAELQGMLPHSTGCCVPGALQLQISSV